MEKNLAVQSDEFGMVAVDPTAFPDLDKAETGINVDPKYKHFKEGETIRAIFCGFVALQNEDGTTAAVLQTKDGFYLNSGTSLIKQLQNLRRGTAVQVTYSGEKALGGGKRVNVFQVVLLKVGAPIPTQSVGVPSPAADPEPESDPEVIEVESEVVKPAPVTKPNRPLDPETLRKYFPAKIKKLEAEKVACASTSRGVLAVMLNTTLGEENRRVLTLWLVGKQHISDMSDAEVMALLAWLECHLFSSVPPQYVIEEARAAYEAAVNAA